MRHSPRKRFGQHFLHDPATIGRIVEAIAPRRGETVVEIGPGRGAITGALLERFERLHVVELDRDLIEPLRTTFAEHGELVLHSHDALTFDFAALAPPEGLRVVGNLPYNISTPLIFYLLTMSHALADMHFLLQKEVVERLTAPPGDGTYGRLSVMAQYRCRTEKCFAIASGAFSPPPKVTSAFVRLIPHKQPPVRVDDEKAFADIVKRAFSQRRKTIRNALKDVCSAHTIEAAGIAPGLRPEQLSLADFAALANHSASH